MNIARLAKSMFQDLRFKPVQIVPTLPYRGNAIHKIGNYFGKPLNIVTPIFRYDSDSIKLYSNKDDGNGMRYRKTFLGWEPVIAVKGLPCLILSGGRIDDKIQEVLKLYK